MRWLFAIVAAAAVGYAVYAIGGGAELSYLARSITRHVAGGYHR
jgi:hypothetical protein